jgi:hypothetical protein
MTDEEFTSDKGRKFRQRGKKQNDRKDHGGDRMETL